MHLTTVRRFIEFCSASEHLRVVARHRLPADLHRAHVHVQVLCTFAVGVILETITDRHANVLPAVRRQHRRLDLRERSDEGRACRIVDQSPCHSRGAARPIGARARTRIGPTADGARVAATVPSHTPVVDVLRKVAVLVVVVMKVVITAADHKRPDVAVEERIARNLVARGHIIQVQGLGSEAVNLVAREVGPDILKPAAASRVIDHTSDRHATRRGTLWNVRVVDDL